MSFLKDVLGFESFHLKDIGRKIRDDPKRLLIGGIDPWSTKVNNKIFGTDYEPLVDQMGGAYGGDTLTLGDTGEGVYGRARAAGVPTEAGSQMQDLAHLISSMFVGNYGAGKLPSIPGMDKLGGGIPGGGMKGGGGQAPPPIPTSFMPSQRQGTLPTGMAQALSNRGPNNNQSLALLAALLRGKNG